VADVVLDASAHELVRADLGAAQDRLTRAKLEILAKLRDADAPISRPRIRLAYGLTPRRISGADRVDGVEFVRTGTEDVVRVDAGLALTSIGYHGKAIRDLPFDQAAGVVPNDRGRVTGAPGSYVAGWIKRGPTGFIGTNKSCALETVQELVADYNAGLLTDPVARAGALEKLVAVRQPHAVGADGWHAIDAAEIARGGAQRPRDKFTNVAAMLAVAADAPKRTVRQRILSGLRR